MAKMRVPVVVLLGILFVLSLAVSIGVANGKKDVMNKSHQRSQEEEQERQPWSRHRRPQEEKEEQQQEEEEEWRREHRQDDPEERERRRISVRRQRKEREEEEEEHESQRERRRQRNNNPYHLSSNKFQTLYKNRNGQIRVLQRFDKNNHKLENLKNYRIVEFESKPQTLILPHHSDADYILVVLQGSPTVTLLNPPNSDNPSKTGVTPQAYNLEPGHALRLPSGTTYYILNRHDSQNLRILKLAIPVNNPASFDDFFPSNTQDQESYYSGFSKNFLEAFLNAPYEEIERTLLGEEEEEEQNRRQEQKDEGVIVRVSKEQIQELSKHAQSSSSSQSQSQSQSVEPFNLRSDQPIYSNQFGNFYEITPQSNSQLQDVEIALTYTEIKEGALLLPHHNSKAIFIVVAVDGDGNYQLVGPKEQQQEEEEEEEGNDRYEVRRYSGKLSKDNVIIIPAGYPLSINASSTLRLIGFGINANNNVRTFLAGREDNVILLFPNEVTKLTFPGSAQDVQRLIKKQQQSYFANANPQQQQREGRRGRRDPLSSILSALS